MNRISRLLCLLLAAVVLFTVFGMAVSAETSAESEASAESIDTTTEPEESSESGNNAPITPFSAHSPAMAYCVDTEQVLFETRADEKMAAGIVTKLCALAVAYDLISDVDRPMTTTVTLKKEWLKDSYIAGDRSTPYIGLKADEEYTLEYLFLASLVGNACDAAAVLVRYCAEVILQETEQGFLSRMNDKAASLGMENTRFEKATGANGGNYTTVRDAMKLLAAFYYYNELVTGSNCVSYGYLKNKNYLMCDKVVSGYRNTEAVGLLAGQSTNEGGYAVATYHITNGIVYAYLVMGGSSERIDTDGEHWFDEGNAYEDINALIPWVNKAYDYMTLCAKDDLIAELRMGDGAEADHLIIVPEKEVELLVYDPDSAPFSKTVKFDTEKVYDSEYNGKPVKCVDAPVKQGDKLGKVTFYHGSKELATVDLVARDSVGINELRQGMSRIRSFLFEGPMGKIVKIVLIFVGIWVLLALVLFIWRIVKYFRNRKKSKNVNKL